MQMEQMSREEEKAVLSVYLKNGSQELRNLWNYAADLADSPSFNLG